MNDNCSKFLQKSHTYPPFSTTFRRNLAVNYWLSWATDSRNLISLNAIIVPSYKSSVIKIWLPITLFLYKMYQGVIFVFVQSIRYFIPQSTCIRNQRNENEFKELKPFFLSEMMCSVSVNITHFSRASFVRNRWDNDISSLIVLVKWLKNKEQLYGTRL